jgi:hypothetical protein
MGLLRERVIMIKNMLKSSSWYALGLLLSVLVFLYIQFAPLLIGTIVAEVCDLSGCRYQIPVYAALLLLVALMAAAIAISSKMLLLFDIPSKIIRKEGEKPIFIIRRRLQKITFRAVLRTHIAFWVSITLFFIIPDFFREPIGSIKSVKQDGLLVTFDGDISVDGLAKFSEALMGAVSTSHPGETITLSLNSGGGDVGVMEAMRIMVNAIPKDRVVKTVIPDGGLCASACVPIWLSGAERSAGYNSAIMIHEASLVIPKMGFGIPDTFAELFGVMYGRVKLAISGSIVRNLIHDQAKPLYDLTDRQGVWNWLTRHDCWMTGTQVRAILDGVEGQEIRECHGSDPRIRTKDGGLL